MSYGAVRRSFRPYALHWRALSTSADVPSPSSSHHAPTRDTGNMRTFHPRMIFVRPWAGIPTMAHAFAIIRDIERRFGRIQEFVVVRDSDVYSECSPYMHATFIRAEDAAAIPLEGKVVQVVEPGVDRTRDGGIGLDDLHVYLNAESVEEMLSKEDSAPEKEASQGPPHVQLMDVKLERSGLRGAPSVLDQPLIGRRGPPYLNNPMRTQELAHAIHAFGGFVDRPNGPPESQTPMEAVVSRWSRMRNRKDTPQPRSEPVQQTAGDENPTNNSEEPATPEKEGTITIPWSSFETKSETSSLTPFTPLPDTPMPSPSPPAAPLPISPSIPSSPSKPILTTNTQNPPRPDSKPKPAPPMPEPNIPPAEPKISKKQRMLNAARLAGAMAAQRPKASEDFVVTPPQTAPLFDAAAEQTTAELDHDPQASEEENNAAARKWWKFLTGGN